MISNTNPEELSLLQDGYCNNEKKMKSFTCIRAGVTQVPNTQFEKCRTEAGQWEIGRCRCAEDRNKFRIRIRELTSDFATLTSVDVCCVNPVLNRTLSKQDSSRKILEEIIRLETLLQVLDGCKNAFSTAKTDSLILANSSTQTTVKSQLWPVQMIPGGDSTTEAAKNDRQLPEHLLAPMRENAVHSYSLGRKRKEHFRQLWQNTIMRTARSCVDDTTMRMMIVDEDQQQCGRPNLKEEENCVLVYGFPPEAINRIDGTVIGVTRWSCGKGDPGEESVSRQCDAGVISVRKHLKLMAGKLEEFTPRKLQVWNYISKDKVMFTLFFFIMWFIVFY